MLFKRITVHQHHRTLVARNNRITHILVPGSHRLFVPPFASVEIEAHSLHTPVVRTKWLGTLLRERPDLVRDHFIVVTTDNSHLAMISVEGALYQVLLPGRKLVLWRDAARITVEMVNIVETPPISERMLDGFEHGPAERKRGWDVTSDSGISPLIDRVLDFENSSTRQ